MSTPQFKPVRELRDVTPARFRDEIVPAQEPVLLRGAVADWPAVRAGREAPQAVANYLRALDNGTPADTMIGPPSIGGHFFYNDDLTGYNFERRPLRVAEALDRLMQLLDQPHSEALYVGSVPTPKNFPAFTHDNTMPLLDPAIVPRVWFCNRVTVQTHYDISSNLACVVAGRRRFTLFPPEQVVNLYVGPVEFTLAGQPISLVKLENPDFERYPRYREALDAAQAADLEPGDALFIPYMWWHHVQSRDAFNVLVNYWWEETPMWQGSPFEALLHGILSVKNLSPRKRAIWQNMFQHYVFQQNGDPVAHLTQRQRGIQGDPNPRLAEIIRQQLIHVMSRGRR
jgi:hypothetical protein